MPGYLVPPTKNPGDVLTSALWNTYIRDNLDFGMVRPIAHTVVAGSPAASIDFTSIPATFAHLLLVLYGRDTFAASTSNVTARLNNDSAGNYYSELLTAGAAVAAASEQLAQTSGRIGNMPGSTALATGFGTLQMLIPQYTDAANLQSYKASSGYMTGTGTGGIAIADTAGFWNAVAAVNRLTLLPGGTAFAIGTCATLYGMGGI